MATSSPSPQTGLSPAAVGHMASQKMTTPVVVAEIPQHPPTSYPAEHEITTF